MSSMEEQADQEARAESQVQERRAEYQVYMRREHGGYGIYRSSYDAAMSIGSMTSICDTETHRCTNIRLREGQVGGPYRIHFHAESPAQTATQARKQAREQAQARIAEDTRNRMRGIYFDEPSQAISIREPAREEEGVPVPERTNPGPRHVMPSWATDRDRRIINHVLDTVEERYALRRDVPTSEAITTALRRSEVQAAIARNVTRNNSALRGLQDRHEREPYDRVLIEQRSDDTKHVHGPYRSSDIFDAMARIQGPTTIGLYPRRIVQ